MNAVFLSYTREDTAAAQRIAEALRSQGVEVWFDQSELRGGDEWDRKIRRQIKDCVLFMPVISAHTEERGEGYFRLEWKLAVERTHLMAEGVPFLAPVVVDGTSEAGASVPEPFLRVQWTRLPGALPTPQFIEQMKRLLDAPRKPAGGQRAEGGGRTSDGGGLVAEGGGRSSEGGVRRSTPAKRVSARTIIVGALALVAVVAVVMVTNRNEPAARRSAPPTSEKTAVSARDLAPAKSLAVLPFENLSPEKENEFFTSGIHEEILAALQTVRELHVIQYRGVKKAVRQIGEELNVAYALECSVRRAGTKVRVTGKLTDARTEVQVWADNFEGDLTDVFAIQSELAKAIASKLSAAISPGEKTTIERRPTTSVAAYDLYLKARDIRYRTLNTADSTQRTEALFASAVELDPQFALAWGELAYTHAFLYSGNNDRTEARLARARAALATMERLAPGDPETFRQQGNYAYFASRDYARATELFQRVVALRPNDPESYYSLCQVQRRQGKWVECLANFRRAIALDPQNDRLLRNAAVTLDFCRHYDEALALDRRRVELLPAEDAPRLQIALDAFRAKADTSEGDRVLKDASATARWLWAVQKGDYAEAVRLEPALPEAGRNRNDYTVTAAYSLLALGDEAGARQRVARNFDRVKGDLAMQPTNARLWMTLGQIQSVLGRHEEALASGRKAMELTPETTEAIEGAQRAAEMASIHAWSGDTERALAEFARLLGNGGANVHELRVAVLPAALRRDPRFEALLKDPKNNAPLF